MTFKLVFSPRFDRDCIYWEETQPALRIKVNRLLASIQATPRGGIGKPERLKHFHPNEVWSRRISGEHRLVYRIEGHFVYLMGARYHYQR